MTARLDALLERTSELLSTESQRAIRSVLASSPKAIWELRLAREDELFRHTECQQIRLLSAEAESKVRALAPHTVVILKATRLCNLRCSYCTSWREGPGNVMPFEVLARITRDVLRTPGIRTVDFVWHGGEVTLLPTKYMRRALWLQQRFVQPETEIANSIQTNGTRLTSEWIDFISEFGISVGLSIDGPPEIHDARRLSKDGSGSFLDVQHGIDRLRSAGIPFGALAVIDPCVVRFGAAPFLKYMVELGIRSMALLNAIPSDFEYPTDNRHFIKWGSFAQFLRELFAEWWSKYRNAIEIRELQALVDAVTGVGTGLCVFADNCMGQYLTVEANGDVSACPKYDGAAGYVFGNLLDSELNTLIRESENLRSARADVTRKKQAMSSCENYRYCFGGCPHDVRLSEKLDVGRDSTCCGLGHLIDDIRVATGK